MTYSINDLKDVIKEIGRDVVYQQLNLSAPLLDFPMPGVEKMDKEKVFRVKRQTNALAKVVVKKGGFSSTGLTAGGATRSAAVDQDILWGQFGPKLCETNVFFPEDTLSIAEGDGGIDIVEEAFGSAGQDCARTWDRLCIDHFLGFATATAAVAATSIPIDDVSGYRANQTIDHFNAAGTVRIQQLIVLDVVINDDFSGSLTVAALATQVTSGDRFYMKESGGNLAPSNASRKAPVNLADLTVAGTALYSNLAAADQPPGYLDTTTTTLDNLRLRRCFTQIKVRSGKDAKVLLVNPLNAERIYNNQNPILRFGQNETMDTYGPEQRFNKSRIVEDPNQRRTVIDVLCADEDVLNIRMFWEPRPAGATGLGNRRKWDRDSLLVSQTRVGNVMLLTSALNMGVSMRNAVARMNNISA